jgi:acyl-coenzyme A synthetase/AMP-(fatty) acid ligase
LGKYKHPRDVLFVDALPRNAMRKVMKNVLHDLVSQ